VGLLIKVVFLGSYGNPIVMRGNFKILKTSLDLTRNKVCDYCVTIFGKCALCESILLVGRPKYRRDCLRNILFHTQQIRQYSIPREFYH
jgi:hypothetical protein